MCYNYIAVVAALINYNYLKFLSLSTTYSFLRSANYYYNFYMSYA